jgi:hypothetical protein
MCSPLSEKITHVVHDAYSSRFLSRQDGDLPPVLFPNIEDNTVVIIKHGGTRPGPRGYQESALTRNGS